MGTRKKFRQQSGKACQYRAMCIASDTVNKAAIVSQSFAWHAPLNQVVFNFATKARKTVIFLYDRASG
jgi:hypothetical protein